MDNVYLLIVFRKLSRGFQYFELDALFAFSLQLKPLLVVRLLSVRIENRLKAERHRTERALVQALSRMGCHVLCQTDLDLK